MSYGVIYRHEFTDEYDRRKRADVLKKDYDGSITEKTGATHSPLHISIQSQGDDKYTTVKPTEIELKIYSDNFEFDAITEAGDKDYQIRVYEAPTEDGDLSLKHIGYVIPEIYSEPYVVEPYPASIRAASMGILNAERYVTDTYGEFYTGTATLMTVITRCLNKLGYEIDIWDSTNTFEDRITYHDDSPLKTIKVNQDAFVVEEKGREQALTCMEVLERVLKPFVVNFFMDYGRWVIIPIEHRATQREVKIYDYQGTYVETGNYNPLAQTFNFLNQDQNLEFLPVVRDIESVFNHGIPNDIVENHRFDGDYVEVSKSVGSIWYPEDWTLSDSDDFDTIEVGSTSTQIYSGIRYIGDGVFDGDSRSVFMHSALIDDGAYIEHQGTKTVEAGEDSIRFKILYSGVVKLWSGDLSLDDGTAPEQTIDHKFQIKLGSKYLNAEGGWQSTEVDIKLTDLGDSNWRYPTSNLGSDGEPRLGVANNFRDFEIVSDTIEEEGTIRVRIYKPVSENEGPGPGDGDTYCTTAYSLFSLLPYADGEPPEEATTFFSERDITSYAEEVQYDTHFGDGPTKFHDASYLINVSGADLVTDSWTRGEYSGGIEDIYINTIFLEYFTKSNLIRGTQKVKGLFDRWFIDFAKGYTVLAGTYDERMCTFNGEMVEILNSEADIWGDPLEAPENFQVFTSDIIEFGTDTFYTIGQKPGGTGDDELIIKKGTYDETRSSGDAVVSFTDTFDFKAEGITHDGRYPKIYQLKNDNLLVLLTDSTSSTAGDQRVFLFDTDLNLLNSSTFEAKNNEWEIWATTDLNGNIYINEGVNSGCRFRKYDSDLNFLLSSETLSVSTFSDNAPARMNLIATSQGIILWCWGEAGEFIKGFYGFDGTQVKTLELGDSGASSNHAFTITTDEQVVFFGNESGFNVYDNEMNLVKTVAKSAFSFPNDNFSGFSDMHAYKDGIIYLWNANNGISILNIETETLVAQVSTSEFAYLFNFDAQERIIATTRQSSTRIFRIRNLSGSNVNSEIITSEITGNPSTAMPYLNWQLDYFGVDTGTPTITNVVLSADPSTETVPFTSTITFGADNTGDADVTLLLTREGSELTSLTIPAGGSASDTYSEGFLNPGSYEIEFAGSSITITANGDTVSGDSEGWIDIDSAATDDTEEENPDANIDVIHTPSQQSDECGTGGTEFNVEWKGTDYCSILPDGPDKEAVAQAVSGNISSGVTGLGSTYPGLSPSGYPRIRVYSETAGTADNGEEVIFGVPSELEQDGGVFSRYTVNLTGGVDEYIVNEEIDILIGGSVFATTSAIDNLETADSIAQKIYDACIAVGSGTYSFAKNGTRVLVGSTDGSETLDLDIKNAGFEYSTQDIQ